MTIHTLRHRRMRLLEAGVEVSVIALWLGHQHTNSTDRLPPRRHDDQTDSYQGSGVVD